jgi:hypothetical protein
MGKPQSWPPWAVKSLRQKLDDLESLVFEARGLDPDILAWLSRMLVVRSSGFIEQTAKEVCWNHVENRVGGIAKAFALSWLERSRNPSPDNLSELVGRFDASMQAEFVGLLEKDDQRIRRELALLVDRRNRIAHGLNESVSREKALALKETATEVSDWLILRFNPF